MPAAVRRGAPHRCGAPALWGHGMLRERPAEAPQMSGNAPCSAMMHPSNFSDITYLHKFLGMMCFPMLHTSKCACGGPRSMVHPIYCFIKLGYWNLKLETWDLGLGTWNISGMMLHTKPGDISIPIPRSSLAKCFNMLITSKCMTLRLDIVWRSLDPESCDLERRTSTFKFEVGILKFEDWMLAFEV